MKGLLFVQRWTVTGGEKHERVKDEADGAQNGEGQGRELVPLHWTGGQKSQCMEARAGDIRRPAHSWLS